MKESRKEEKVGAAEMKRNSITRNIGKIIPEVIETDDAVTTQDCPLLEGDIVLYYNQTL